MDTFLHRIKPYIISIAAVLMVSMLCYAFSDQITYRVVALILLLTISVIGMFYYIYPVILAVILSALIWNYFFIPPLFELGIHDAEDILLVLSYFFIALLNVVLTFKIRQTERKTREKFENDKSVKLYNTIFNSLSHELKTPLATIIGSTDTLKENIDRLSREKQLELIDEIDIATLRLNRQLNNILNMSRLSSNLLKPQLDWCDMNELVNNTTEKIFLPYKQTLVYEENENLPYFKLDAGFMELILTNLLINSIQYTSDNSTIVIEIEHEEESCVVRVKDNGEGIPKDELAFIFDKFYRGPSVKSGGSGLGLSIVKGYTEAQNGSVKVENNIPAGLVFTIQIPCETTYINQLKNE
ncbi:MAG: DUF4118 domain-containing protein [Saprospiraceae bacterium]|nr:DUF4118 domain-containing protein [Saprospiraceae bacterium]